MTKRDNRASENMVALPSIAFLLAKEPPASDLTLPPIAPSRNSDPAHEQQQLATPPLTERSSSSPRSIEIDVSTTADVDGSLNHLQVLLSLPELPVAAAIDVARELLHDSSIKPAYDQGWFKPTSPMNVFSKRIEGHIAGKSLDDLVDCFFRRDESRELYGERVSKPRKLVKKASLEEPQETKVLDSESLARRKKRQEADEAHRIAENDRRDRHRNSQMESHRRCPDLAAECGSEHAKAEKKTRFQSGKGPGKDDQLWAAIYAHEMAGRVVQSVNDQRIQSVMVAQLLLKLVIQQQELLNNAQRELSHYKSARESFPTHPDYAGWKRKRDDME
ncbi:hypothetical protein AYL99_05842 [Fonsecaea erecta]|uniref:Uncharacterized protein n=1 Tax=Fonsecaea erecta TaxID=1367422 RepID=A0A178ZM13_9EURO|nr:hypothetical protein AYL99_05842 [Fonsecaea erecta]OAP60840.1 hypothetical protein AYL99_05842 [Fonsecaea erecta]